ncbi:MAG: heparinase II/III domain-containing protein, partial [Candidatus Latescibacterota bacterium]
DFLKFATAFGTTEALYDLNSNGKVDLPDFIIFVTQYQQQNTQTGAPNPDTFLNTLDKNHPRLMLKDDQLAQLKTLWETDTALKKILSDVITEADILVSKAPLQHVLIGPRLLSVSRDALDRIYHLGIAYRWTSNVKYLDAGRDVLLTVVAFPDWNPSHFLDVAEMTHAVGIGYDWFYPALNEQTRNTIKTGLIRHGLQEGIKAYTGTKPAWWISSEFNWNQVCNGGLIVGALAIAETDPQYAQQIIPEVYKSLPTALKTYEPDGAWGEGPGYWDYATRYTVYGLSALDTALGTTFGLKNKNGLTKAGYFPVHGAGPTDYYFNYADVGETAKRTPMPSNFWLASAYEDDFIGASEHAIVARKKAEPQHIMWYVPKPNISAIPELDRKFGGIVAVAFLRSSWEDPNAVFVGIKAGYNQVNHGHLDLGNFVVDALGERWASDLGSDDYNLPNYFGSGINATRWTYYRLNSESHNVPLINNKSQHPNGTARLIGFRSEGAFPYATVDLSQAYLENASGKIIRGIALINNRQDILIQDEYNLDNPRFIQWGITTKATIALQTDGSAILTQ